jgi:hypothetical protein
VSQLLRFAPHLDHHTQSRNEARKCAEQRLRFRDRARRKFKRGHFDSLLRWQHAGELAWSGLEEAALDFALGFVSESLAVAVEIASNFALGTLHIGLLDRVEQSA